jgi:uncharacterized membrane protein YedE/YeeE
MNSVIDFLSQTWHWFPSGVGIAVVMLFLILLGKSFGVSSSFQALCSASGAGRWIDYFDYDWKNHDWLLTFVVGSMIGGYLAVRFLDDGVTNHINVDTVTALSELGISVQESSDKTQFIPLEIFNFENLTTMPGLIIMVGGGFLIGFGARWAGGCTSGHAISGLSNFQMPSLVAVIGFFIGGLLMTHILLPLILNL